MEFEKVSEDGNMNETLLSSSAILSQSNINRENIDEQNPQNVDEFYEGSIKANLRHCDANPSHKEVTEVPSSVPIYLFATNPSEDGFTVTDDLNFKHQDISSSSQIFKDSVDVSGFPVSMELPLTYYPSAVTSGNGMISIVGKSNDATQVTNVPNQESVATNELSEEMIRSFVVGGNRISPRLESKKLSDDLMNDNDEEPCMITVVTNDLVNEQTVNINETEKQIVIVTEGDEEIDDLMIETQSSPRGHFRDPSTRLEDFSDSNGKITVALIPDKNDASVGGNSSYESLYNNMGNHPTSAEEILKNHPVLHMDFQVEAEIADLNGVVLGREITTQTKPLRKPKTVNKRKVKVDLQHTELKVILTTDDDVEVKRKRMSEIEANQPGFRQHKCTRCTLRFLDQETLDIHLRCHSLLPDEKGYACYECDFTHTQWIKMYHHLFSHGIKKPFKCPQCSFSCVNKSDLSAHMFVHSATKDWLCPKCNRLFKHRRNMIAHERVCLGLDDCGKPKKIETAEECICSICNKQLSNKRNLDKHLEIHMDVKPFVCNLCGHSTRLKESLIMHKRLHTGEKPFKCDQCDYSTPDKSSLRRHKRRHTNEKPYCCTFCDYKAIQKHCLDTHIRRKHTGEQFVCGLCHYTTYDRYGLNQHFKQHQQEGLVEATTDESCIVDVAGVALPTENDKTPSSESGNVFLRISENNDGSTNDKHDNNVWDAATSTNTPNTTSLPINSVQYSVNGQHALLGGPEESLLQQIQQPGDLVFLQENGAIVIKKPDGRILIIQQEEDESTTENSTILQT